MLETILKQTVRFLWFESFGFQFHEVLRCQNQKIYLGRRQQQPKQQQRDEMTLEIIDEIETIPTN